MIRKPATFATTTLGCLLLITASLGPAEAQQYLISTVVGEAPLPQPTPVRGVDLTIEQARGVATDSSGNTYFTSDNYIFKLDQNGVATRIAGIARAGYSGDGGPATNAQLGSPTGIAVDPAGNLFFVDNFSVIRKISPSGIIVTVAGNGTQGYSGDGGPATSAQLYQPYGVAVDGAGNLFISEVYNYRVRKVSPDGIITTVAGNGTPGYSGDGGPAASAQLNAPTGVAVDGAGNLFIADTGNRRIRQVSKDGTIATVAGDGTPGLSGDGGQATSARLGGPNAVALDGAGNLFITDIYYDDDGDLIDSVIRKVSSNGIITTVAEVVGYGVAVDGAGNLFIVQPGFPIVVKVSPSGIVTTVAGPGNPGMATFSGDGGQAASAQLDEPAGVAVDGAGNLFIADTGNFRVRKVSPSGIITTVAGNGTRGHSGDSGPATSAQLNGPAGVAVDTVGNLFIADFDRIRKVSPSGIITTVVEGLGVSAYGVTVDGASNLFIAALTSVLKVSPSGIVTTVAGTGKSGFSGDGGPATSAQLNQAAGVAVDRAGNLFISEVYNYRIREVFPDGIITTVAGNGIPGFSGDGGPATNAQLNGPDGIAVDGAGNLYIADVWNSRIRKVSPAGVITSVIPLEGSSGVYGVAVDNSGNIYIADNFSNAVRVLRPTNQSVFISAVVDAASQSAITVSPGKIVVLYGAGLGPAQLVQNLPSNGQFGTSVGGTAVSFNGLPAPVLYASATQVAAVVPYAIGGATAQVGVTYQGQASAAVAVPVALSAPSLFTLNETGSGQATAINADGTVNTAANPVKIGSSITLYATGEGQTLPGGVDGKVGGSSPILPVKVMIGGVQATSSAGDAPGQVSGLLQLNVQIPTGVQPGGYVPVVLQVGDASTTLGAVWIAVSGN